MHRLVISLKIIPVLLLPVFLFKIAPAAKRDVNSPDDSTQPTWYRLYYNGIAKYKAGLFKEAKHDFDRALSYHQELSKAHEYLAYILIREGQHDRALRHLIRALDKQKNNEQIYYHIISIYHEKNSLRNAQRYLDNALRNFPNQAIFFYLQLRQHILSSDLLSYRKERRKMEEIFQPFIRKKMDSAILYFNQSRFKQAYDLLRQIIEKYPATTGAYKLLAKIHRIFGKKDLALRSYLEIYKIDPWDRDNLIILANLYFEKNNLKNARYYFELALDLGSENERQSKKPAKEMRRDEIRREIYFRLFTLAKDTGDVPYQQKLTERAKKEGIIFNYSDADK